MKNHNVRERKGRENSVIIWKHRSENPQGTGQGSENRRYSKWSSLLLLLVLQGFLKSTKSGPKTKYYDLSAAEILEISYDSFRKILPPKESMISSVDGLICCLKHK